jgi:hypothetical protein
MSILRRWPCRRFTCGSIYTECNFTIDTLSIRHAKFVRVIYRQPIYLPVESVRINLLKRYLRLNGSMGTVPG